MTALQHGCLPAELSLNSNDHVMSHVTQAFDDHTPPDCLVQDPY
jgi:hypothetical protein